MRITHTHTPTHTHTHTKFIKKLTKCYTYWFVAIIFAKGYMYCTVFNQYDRQPRVDLQEKTFAWISSRITCSTKFFHRGIEVCQCVVQKTKNSNDYKLYMTNVP